jgi:hypothetical protein
MKVGSKQYSRRLYLRRRTADAGRRRDELQIIDRIRFRRRFHCANSMPQLAGFICHAEVSPQLSM